MVLCGSDLLAREQSHKVGVQLWLDHDLEVILKHARKVVLQVRAAVIVVNLHPIWRVLATAEVGLELACKDSKSGRFANAVGAEEAEDGAGAGRGQPVQLERVDPVLICAQAIAQTREPQHACRGRATVPSAAIMGAYV